MTRRLRVVFAGTPDFAVPSLRACLESGSDVQAVYTQPDRPSGRGRKLTASPVKVAALEAGVPVEQPESFRTLEARHRLAELRPDLMIVVAYGLILSPRVLAIPQLGCWNVHASLLPRWRGAAPIQRALLAGDAHTGVGLMQMEVGLDTGPVLLQRQISMAADETGGSLHDRLAVLGADVLAEGLRLLAAGNLPKPEVQSSEGITYAHKLDKVEAQLDWTKSALELERKVRAFNPWPVAETQIFGERLRVWSALAHSRRVSMPCGEVIGLGTDGIDVACGEGVLRITSIQRDGGRRMSVADWLNARPELLRLAALPRQ